MLTLEQLKGVVHKKGISRTNVALLCVAAAGGQGVPTSKAKQLAVQAGVKKGKDINFSAHLGSAEDKVFRTPSGWELTPAGRAHVAALSGEVLSSSPAATEAKALRALLSEVKHNDGVAFVTEAIVCAEQSLFRAAVVLSWSGAVSTLQHEVVSKHLAAFNAEATRRDAKWKAAKTPDDLGRMKEATFLQVCEAISLFGNNVKQELESCLKLRNACGHPNSLKIASNKVAAHLEVLTLNVFAVFA